jgi:predicted O-methyltransferase YrrM
MAAGVQEKHAVRAVRPVVWPLAALALRRARAQVRTVEEAVDLAYRFGFAGIGLDPQQVRGEIAGLVSMLSDRSPRVVLELGTARGATLFLFTQVAAPDARLVTMDVGSAAWRALFYRSFARRGQRVDLVRADSHRPETLGRVKDLLGGRRVDFLFVDGDHGYEGVRQDFETYAPLVREGGLIALHDIVPGPEEMVGGVPKFWLELKASRPTSEIVESWDQGGFGIGLVEAPEAARGPIP